MQSIDLKFIQGPLYASRLGAGHLIHSYSDCMVQSLLYHTAPENEVFKTISDHTASVVALTKTFSGESIQCYKCILDPLVQRVPLNGGPVPICDCHAAWGATVFQLPGVISHDSLRWKRNVETRTHSAPKNHSLPALEKAPFLKDPSSMIGPSNVGNKVIRGRCRHP